MTPPRRDPPEPDTLPDHGDTNRDEEELVDAARAAEADDEVPGDAPDVELGAEPLAPATDDGEDGLNDPSGPSG